MRAAVLQDIGQPLRIATVADPTPGPGDLILRVDACGICGSDLHLSDAFGLPGVILGHEFCGTVAELGPDTAGWSVGDHAVALSLRTCGACGPCRTGRPRKCLSARMIGMDEAGAYAEYVRVRAGDAFRLPSSMDPRHGALIEPLAVALHTIDRAGVETGDNVLILGGGPVGLAVAMWAHHVGAREVVLSDPVASRRAMAERVGATATIDPTTQSVAAEIVGLTGALPPIVIECVGIPGLVQQAIDVVALDGRVIIAGVCMAPDTITPLTAMTKEIDLRFAFFYRAKDFSFTIDLIDQGRFDPLPLVTNEITLDELPGRFEALKSPTDECKVLIRP